MGAAAAAAGGPWNVGAAAAGEPLERGRGGDGSGRRTPGAWARRPADARAVGVAAAAGGHLDADEMR